MLEMLQRHNNRPGHLHLMVKVSHFPFIRYLTLMYFQAKGYHTLVTALYMDGDEFLTSDTVFGVKKSLVVVRMNAFGPR
jgi:protocatechuate 3,4-dioxygenase beta subunit